MIKLFESFDSEWVECPKDYRFKIGEVVKINPNSEYANQVSGDGTGVITDDYEWGHNTDNDHWTVRWLEGLDDCEYWRKDLLVHSIKDETKKIRWYKNGKLSESISSKNPFSRIKDYSIHSLLQDDDDVIESIKVRFKHRMEINDYISISQYKKYLNKIFVGNEIVFPYENKDSLFVTQATIKKVSILSDGDIKSFTDVFDRKYNYVEGYDIIDFNKCVKLLDVLIGSDIEFTEMNERKSNKTTSIKLKNIITKKQDNNTEIYFLDNDDKKYRIDIFYPITKPRIYSIEDPYGEEDWE